MSSLDPIASPSTPEESTEVVFDPPRSSGEIRRDALLRTLDGPFFQVLGIVVIIGVVGSGALFFFFLMGWQTLCRPRTDCQPRNDIYNASIQVLNIFFTYMALFSMPWRSVMFLHSTGYSCPRRSNETGQDLYGHATEDVWFHVPRSRRLVVLFFLLANCLTQFANQATRIIYYNYELQNEFPGNLWTNIFFGISFLCAGIGGGFLWHYTSQVRQAHPGRFGPGPIDMVKELWKQYTRKEKITERTNEAVLEADEAEWQDEGAEEYVDPTRNLAERTVLRRPSRASMRLFAM